MTFKGIWTAIWTPVDSSGKIMERAIEAHLSFLKQAGVRGVLVGGSTGEFVRLTLKQRKSLLDTIMKYAGPLQVLVNISDNIHENRKELSKQALEYKVSGALILPPSYYPVPQEDIAAYFLEVVLDTKDLPLLLYNYPECVRNPIEIETIKGLLKKIPLQGIKHSGSSNFEYNRKLVKIDPNFSVLTGADTRLPEALEMGVVGSIGGMSNALADLIVQVFKDPQKQKEAQSKLEAISSILSPLPFPFNIAACMQAKGLEVGSPKIARSTKSLELHQKVLRELKVLV